ncbi:hypothetical protein [Streptomyces sp. NPDC093589]|uniref:hypothetical protein n=1 Tax=Streptomyces sp. NPDC093589 TaxID=3366043 RepID=UPI0037FA1151
MPSPSAAGRYSNAVRDVLDQDAMRCIRTCKSEPEQLAMMCSVVSSKVEVRDAKYSPVVDRMVRNMCTTSLKKVRRELAITSLTGPPGPAEPGSTEMGTGCGTIGSDPGSVLVPGLRGGSSDEEKVVAKVLIDENGELTEKTAQQLVLEDVDRIMEVIPPLAERHFMEADQAERAAKRSTQDAKYHRATANRYLALVKRYDRLVVGIDSIPGVFTLAGYLAEVGPEALGMDEEDAELLRYAGAL